MSYDELTNLLSTDLGVAIKGNLRHVVLGARHCWDGVEICGRLCVLAEVTLDRGIFITILGEGI